MGYDMETGTIAAWTKQVGDTVARGDVLAEIETEKSTVEMEAIASGTLVEQTLAPGAGGPGRDRHRIPRDDGQLDRADGLRGGGPLPDLDAAVARADARLRAVAGRAGRTRRPACRCASGASRRTSRRPPSEDIARKAVEGGTAPMAPHPRALRGRPGELADRLGVDVARWSSGCSREPRRAPLVMLDAEDALALTDEAVEQGRDGRGRRARRRGLERRRPAIAALLPPTRPQPRDDRPRAVRACCGRSPSAPRTDAIPLDGIVFPKVEHPEEVDLVHGMLTEAERALGLPVGGIRDGLPHRVGLGGRQLAAIALRAADRLCALVFGLADYSADLGLPQHRERAPVRGLGARDDRGRRGCGRRPGHRRHDPRLPGRRPGARRGRQPRRASWSGWQLVYRDAVRARDFGMLGKWVGHPAQLFAVLLAFEAGVQPDGAGGGGGQARRLRRRGPRGGQGRDDDRRRDVRPGHRPPRPGGPAPGDGARPVRPQRALAAGGHRAGRAGGGHRRRGRERSRS